MGKFSYCKQHLIHFAGKEVEKSIASTTRINQKVDNKKFECTYRETNDLME